MRDDRVRPEVEVYVHEPLDQVLPRRRRRRPIVHRFDVAPSVKDVVEAAGVPHPEVDVVLLDGRPVGFDERVVAGGRIDVYGPGGAAWVETERRVGREPPSPRRFVLDVHLGKLAGLLRLLGFDAWYRQQADDVELAALSARESRILLTRDRGLLKRSEVAHGYCVRSDDAEDQVVEVARRFDLGEVLAPFSRCLECGARLHDATRADVADEVPVRTSAIFEEYRRCSGCGRVNWEGSHYEDLVAVVQRVRRRLARRPFRS